MRGQHRPISPATVARRADSRTILPASAASGAGPRTRPRIAPARIAPARGDGWVPLAISAPRTRARIAPMTSANSAPQTRARIALVRGDGRVPSTNSVPRTWVRIASPSGDGRVLSAICRGRGRGSHPRGETTGSRWQSRRRGRDLAGNSRRPPQHKGRGTQRARKHQPPRLARQGTRRRLGQGKRKCTERGVQYARINFAGFRAVLPQKL